MAVCRKCAQEYMSLRESEKYCPACKEKLPEELRPDSVQDRHLINKQKRQTSE